MNVIRRAAGSVGAWLLARAGKRLTTGGAWPGSGGGFMDAWNTLRRPDAAALVREYESVAYAFATINASVFASTPYRLIVKTEPGQKAPRVPTRRLSRKALDYLRTLDHLRPWLGKAIVVEEVESHALLDLLNYRLLVQSQLYLEVVGHAPHVIQAAKGGLLARVPTRLLALPAHEVQPTPGDSLEEPVAGFKWRNEEFAVDDILWLRFPSLRDPLCGYSSPTIASWEELSLRERQSSRMNATLDNDSIPAAVASPRGEPGGFAAHMDPDQATALEASIIRKFRRGGAGKIAVLSHPLDITPLNVTPRDQEMAKHHDIAKATCSNNYGVPLAMLSSQTNLANLQAARQQHAEQAIEPRCKLFDETFNEQVTARFDGRLALVHDSPVPEDLDQRIKNRESMLKSGRTLNQILEAEGEAPIDGPEGDLRYVPTSLQEVTIVDMAPARPPEAPESRPTRFDP